MSERLHESLSALMDGEADELELRRVLAHKNSEQVNTVWSRYHLIQSSQQVDQSVMHLDISERVRVAIAAEGKQATETAAEKTGLSWLRPVSGFAVAASVAAAVVVGVRSLDNTAPGLLPQDFSQSAQVASTRAYPVDLNGGSGSVTASAETSQAVVLPSPSASLKQQQVTQRMDKYLLRHTQQVSSSPVQGMIPFARVASFETE
jgi:sigma-E factor negative regulatory protein RseA